MPWAAFRTVKKRNTGQNSSHTYKTVFFFIAFFAGLPVVLGRGMVDEVQVCETDDDRS